MAAPVIDRTHLAFDPARPNWMATEPSCFIFRVVDSRSGELMETVVLLAHVARYTKTPEVRHSLKYTAAGTHLDLPESDARGNVNFQIAGTSGVWPSVSGRAAASAKKDGLADGLASLRAIESLFDEVLHPEPGKTTTDRWIQFVDVGAPISKRDPVGDAVFSIMPRQGVQITRDAKSVRTYGFVLTFTGYHRDTRQPTVVNALMVAKRGATLLGLLNTFSFDQIFGQYKMAMMPFTRVLATVATTRGFLEAWVTGLDGFFAGDIAAIGKMLEDFAAIARAIGALGASAEERLTSGALVFSLRELEQVRHSWRRFKASLEAAPSLMSEPAGGAAVVGLVTGVASYPTPIAMASGQPENARPDDVARGRTPSDLSSGRFGVGTARVSAGLSIENFVPPGFSVGDVVRLNNLRWPFVDSARARPAADPSPANDHGPRVVYLGESVFIPILAGDASGVAGADSPATRSLHRVGADLDEITFGVDLLAEDRALVFDEVAGDLRTVGGTANLVQALATRLSTPRGRLGFSPAFGTNLISYAIGGWTTAVLIRLASIEAAETITSDPRIGTIESLEVSTIDGVTTVEFDVTAATASPVGRLSISV